MGRPDLFPEEYEAAANGLLRALREDAPGAAILVAGPLDRGSRSKRVSRLLSVNEPAVIRALRSAALASGAAFVDQRAAFNDQVKHVSLLLCVRDVGPKSRSCWRLWGRSQMPCTIHPLAPVAGSSRFMEDGRAAGQA